MTFKVKEIIKPGETAGVSSVNRDDLNTEFAEHSGNVYFYSQKQADAAAQEMRAKQNLELTVAFMDKDERELAAAAKEKVTETIISNRVKMREDYQEAQSLYAEAVHQHNLAKAATLSMATKRDMLIQLGASERQEIQGNLRMKEHPGNRAMDAMRQAG